MQAMPEISASSIEQLKPPSEPLTDEPMKNPTTAAIAIIITDTTVLNFFIQDHLVFGTYFSILFWEKQAQSMQFLGKNLLDRTVYRRIIAYLCKAVFFVKTDLAAHNVNSLKALLLRLTAGGVYQPFR